MSVLDEAAKAVDGDRGRDYGHPSVNHKCTGDMVRSYLKRKYGPAAQFDEIDVCAFNILQKISRLANTPTHHDSLVDGPGYFRNWEMILERWDVEKITDEVRVLFADLQADGEA